MLDDQTISGLSVLQQTLTPYVTQNSLEYQLQDFAQDIETGQFSLPTFSQLSIDKPATTDINAGGQSIANLKPIDLTAGISGLLATACSIGLATQMFPNTGLQNLTDSASYGNKKLSELADADTIVQNDPAASSKRKQAVNQGFLLDNSVSYGLRKANDGTDDVLQIAGAFSAFKANSIGVFPQIIQGVKDPERDFDAVNKRSTVVEDEKQVEDPLTHNLYDRMQVGDRVFQLKDTLDPVIPPVPGTDFATMVGKQAITKNYADGKFHKKNADIDFGNNKGVNCANPTAASDVVIKSYCDANSKNPDGTGALTGLLGGILGGALGSALASTVGQGLASLGQITGSIAAGTAALSTGLKVGSTADFDRYQASNGESQQLIDNLKSDIANSSPAQPGGALLNGALSIAGLFRAPANSVIGLFDI